MELQSPPSSPSRVLMSSNHPHEYDTAVGEIVLPPESKLYIPLPPKTRDPEFFYTFWTHVFQKKTYIDTRFEVECEWCCRPGHGLTTTQFDPVSKRVLSSCQQLKTLSKRYTNLVDMFFHEMDFDRYHEFRFVRLSSERVRVVLVPETWLRNQNEFSIIGECELEHVSVFIADALKEIEEDIGRNVKLLTSETAALAIGDDTRSNDDDDRHPRSVSCANRLDTRGILQNLSQEHPQMAGSQQGDLRRTRA
ncbi:hypothetical protein JTE90_017598 [Oedothorax gibbosus]|uniref:Uncharacterized protein n=1 Tax=Oedothorax gibbosus TaxID=931172 RepID=A0AAV6TNG1_9ARAC|nr:hypothetical protein JTE90_017598 [Oedothorax gibbosus]